MNLGEIKVRVKRQFGDEAQVQISDIDIIRWANDGQRHVITNNTNLNQTASLSNLVAGQAEYSLPEDLFALSGISVKMTYQKSYYSIKSATLAEFNQSINGWDGSEVSGNAIPTIFFRTGRVVSLFPPPDSAVTNGLKLYYIRMPIDLATNMDIIDLPIEYHTAIVDYCLQQAYELDEDWQASQVKAGQVMSSLHNNKNREEKSSQETYGTITILDDDSW